LLDLGVAQELVEKSGSWFSYSGERIGQGRENARVFLAENPTAADRLDAQLRRHLGLATTGSPISAGSEQPDLAATARTA
jgi:recombination protein RecA